VEQLEARGWGEGADLFRGEVHGEEVNGDIEAPVVVEDQEWLLARGDEGFAEFCEGGCAAALDGGEGEEVGGLVEGGAA